MPNQLTMIQQRESAQIFQFPVGGRAGLKSPRNLNAPSVVPGYGDSVTGGSWYHEEAIRDEQPTRTN